VSWSFAQGSILNSTVSRNEDGIKIENKRGRKILLNSNKTVAVAG